MGKRKKKLTARGAVIQWRREKNSLPKTREARLALLKRWAEVRVVPVLGTGQGRHKDKRSLKERRAAFERMGKAIGQFGECWCCGLMELLFNHHVVQLQHGGTNWHLNIVRICDRCHCDVHPWMKPQPVYAPINVAEIIKNFAATEV